MAYLRYRHDCEWYIFWEASAAQHKQQEKLAGWHVNHRATAESISYQQVRDLLSSRDFSSLPGYTDKDQQVLEETFREFIEDVDQDYEGQKR